jgi:hypothetical protein
MPTKSWGPFNGRQLTTIIVALILGAAMIPTGAFAVTTLKNVVINDPGGINQAHVDATGSLQSSAAPPANFFKFSNVLTHNPMPLAIPPAGTALIVTSIHMDTYDDPAPGVGHNVIFRVQDTHCTTRTSIVDDVTPGGVGMTVLPFETGLAVPADNALCAEQNGSEKADVYVFGYTVPASTVPAAAAGPA